MDCDGSWSGLWGRGGWGVTYRSQQNDRDVPQMFVLSEVFSLSDGRFQISSHIGAIQAYHVQGINHYSVDMGTSRFVGNLRNFVNNVRPETKFRNPFHHSSGIEQCVDE